MSYIQVDYNQLPKQNEALLQSAGYTHLLQIGTAADRPTLSSSPLWRKVSRIQETVGSIAEYVFDVHPSNTQSGLDQDDDDDSSLFDPKQPTHIAYLGIQQLLAGRLPVKDLKTLKKLLAGLGKPLDDRKMLLEDIVGLLATAGVDRKHGPNKSVNGIQSQFINLLWKDLPHPPTTDLLPRHRYRSPDGSENNLTGLPLLGAAGQPYARTVKPLHPHSPQVAEPEDLFDAILKRPPGPGGFRPHPFGISSLLFGFANLIIHDIFWTNNSPIAVSSDPSASTESTKPSGTSNQWQNLTSSYLSLDPLYGTNQEQQAKIRDTGNLGRGLIYPDVFSSSRLLFMPSSTAALLILFSRNHNRVARKVLELNEKNQWNSDLEALSAEDRARQDEEIFGTARLVNCGYFVNMILHDYLQAILGTIQADSDWTLDPRMEIKSLIGSPGKAIGNAVSIEFNVLYRWHASLSQTQTEWLEDKMAKGLPSRKWDELDGVAFRKAIAALRKELNADDESDPRKWNLSKYEVKRSSLGEPIEVNSGVYERDPATGRFRDEDIARILKDATNEVSGAFGARHTPAVLRWIDCQGMRTARDVWRACTINEFRTHLGLKTFETFEEWNSDPAIAKAMEDLVGNPDNMPLHVGLMGEEAKQPRLGAGLCPNYTISRAILSDAVSLVRGDRFYTDSATADTMTDWGLKDCHPDPQDGSYGGMMQRLIINNLPNQYEFNDVALLFPFMVPEKIYSILSSLGPRKALNYTIESPTRYELVGFKTSDGIKGQTLVHEISDTERVQVERMSELFGMPNMKSAIRGVYESLEATLTGGEWKNFERFIQERIRQASTQRNPTNADRTIDILRDVTNPLVSGWLAHMFGLVETGLHSQQLLLNLLSDVYLYLNDPQMTFKNRTAARVAAAGLAWQLKYHIEAASTPSLNLFKIIRKGASILTVGALHVLEDTVKYISGQPIRVNVPADCKAFYHTLVAQNNRRMRLSSDELAADCLRAVATLAHSLSTGAAHALDYLLPKPKNPSDEDLPFDQSLSDLIRAGQEFDATTQNSHDWVREKFCRVGLEASRLNHWDTLLRGMKVTNDQLERNPHNRQIGIIDDKWSLSRENSEYKRLLDVNGDCVKFYSDLIGVIVKEVIKLAKVRKAFGKQGDLNLIHLKGSRSGLYTMHIRFDGTKFRAAEA